MKKYADAKRWEVEFQVGEYVYVKLKPYRQRSLAKRQAEKLSPRFFGPYQILERVGQVAYRLALPTTATIHPVFHVSMLRKALGQNQQPQPIPSILTADLEWQSNPEAVEGMRYNQKGTLEVLIKWQQLPSFENTWEEFDTLNEQLPNFHLEDKVRLWGGGNDRPLIRYTYARKGSTRRKATSNSQM